MNIIDFHSHFFPDEIADHAVQTVAEICDGVIVPVLDGTMDDMIRSMDRNGISKSVTLPVATKPEQVPGINANLPLNSDRIVPFGAANPFSENWENEIDYLVEKGVKGVKLHPEYQGFYIDDPVYYPFYEKLASANLITLFHAGYDPGPFSRDHAKPGMFLSLMENIPNLTIVAGHFGGLLMWDEVLEHLAGKDIWFDTAAICDFIDPKLFEKIVNIHGADKVLYGSDTPWEGQGKSISFITDSGLTDLQKEEILGTNAETLLNRG